MEIISPGPIASQGVQNNPSACDKTKGASDSVDPTFDLLLGQLFAPVLQSGQQTPLDAAKLDDGTNSDGTSVKQPQTPNASQQPADISKLFLGVQNQDKSTTDAENTPAAQFSEVLKNIKGNAEHADPAQKATTETKAPSPDKSAKPAKNDHDDIKNIFSLFDKSGKRDAPLVQDAAGLNVQVEKDEGRQKTEATPPAPGKTDFTILVQQGQSSSQHPAPFDASAKTTDAGAVPVTVRPHGNDPADLFDRSVSIVKDGDGNRLAVQLDHDGLGKLDINLSLDKGAVNAQINVADDAAKKLIENNMQQIVNSLLGEGVSISGFSVSLKQQGTWDGATRYRRDEAEEKSGPVLQPVSAPNAATARGLVNIFI